MIFTATIAPQYGGQATARLPSKGSITMGISGVSGNAASLTTSGLGTDTHSITAVYNGDSNFTGSTSNTVLQVVTKFTTTTTLVSSVNPSGVWQAGYLYCGSVVTGGHAHGQDQIPERHDRSGKGS